MKSFLVLSLAGTLVLANPAFAQQQPTPAPATATAKTGTTEDVARPILPNTLMDGTAVKLRLSETISSAEAHTGQQVSFEVVEDVIVQGVTIIPKGSPALATVTDAESKKRMGRGGKLDVNIDSTRLTDGDKVQLRASKNTKGGGHTGAMTGAIVATSLIFFPAAPLFLFMHGKDITIPKGTEVTAFVQGDTRLDMARLQNPTAPAGTLAAGNALSMGNSLVSSNAPTNTASLQVDSSTPGADIEIDDAFVGSTPSTLAVTPGQHKIALKKKGYTDWTRTMNVSGSSVHLNASLEPKS